MPKSPPRKLDVLAKQTITPNMLRVTLGGAGLAGFPEGSEGGYIKLIFPEAPHSTPERPAMRTYSIRAFDAAQGTLSVDFALHGDAGGLATDWAQRAQPGDQIMIAGPGSIRMVDPAADWHLLAADMTGLPALLCNLDRLPESATGHVVVEITSEADKQPLPLPAGMEVHWIVNPTPDLSKGALVAAIKSLPWRAGRVSVWAACEFDSMRALRNYYRSERGVDRDQIYLSSYWRAGRTEDQHKIDKQADSQAAA